MGSNSLVYVFGLSNVYIYYIMTSIVISPKCYLCNKWHWDACIGTGIGSTKLLQHFHLYNHTTEIKRTIFMGRTNEKHKRPKKKKKKTLKLVTIEDKVLVGRMKRKGLLSLKKPPSNQSKSHVSTLWNVSSNEQF